MKIKKTIIVIGILLMILGGIAIGLDQISYTRKEKILDVGPFEATIEKEAHCLRLPVIFGVLVIVAGICLVAIESRRGR